jgi:hypothetical protein
VSFHVTEAPMVKSVTLRICVVTPPSGIFIMNVAVIPLSSIQFEPQ